MKRILFAMAIVALILGVASRMKAQTDVSIDFFYDNLGDDGNWIEVGDYGYCWQPNVAVSDRGWRPYADGYWAYTDVGWTWVSYENFGWATYHYGRWARLRDTGWVWVPGTEWGPAWVSWRTGGDHVGWAPLPPRRIGGEPVYEGRPITGRVDVEFDIGPEYYNFVDVRYIGEPVLRRRIVDSRENITYMSNTVNVTNITYNNSVVYNGGPDYNRLSAYSTRQIPRLQLQREENVDLRAAARSNAITKVQGNQLVIAAPLKLERGSQAPRVVKTRVERPNLETGWSGIDPKRHADLAAKFKTEDAKTIPPPKVQPVHPEDLKSTGTGAAPTVGANPAAVESAAPVQEVPDIKKQRDDLTMRTPTPIPALAPNESKIGRGNRRGLNAIPRVTASPVSTPSSAEPTGTPAVSPNENKIRPRGERPPKSLPTATPSPAVPLTESNVTPANAPNEFKGRGRRDVAPVTSATATAAPRNDGESTLHPASEFNARRGAAPSGGPVETGDQKLQKREVNNERNRGMKEKKNEKVPSPTPGQ